MKLEINVPVSGLDLANLLEGEQGLFLSQSRGQNYITVAKPGQPIVFGPMPIGQPILEQVPTPGPEPWVVTNISNSTALREFRGASDVPRQGKPTKARRTIKKPRRERRRGLLV